MWFRFGVRIKPRLIGFESCPVDEARMMVPEQNSPLFHGQMSHPFPDGAVCINVTFVASLTVGVSASIHRIGQDLVDSMVGGSHPADGTGHAGGQNLQRKRQTFGTEPEPNPPCRAELGEPLEDRADRSDDGFIGMEEDLTILSAPN